jgi:hypothetical protein
MKRARRICFRKADVFCLPFADSCFDILELAEEKGDERGFWHALMRRRTEVE